MKIARELIFYSTPTAIDDNLYIYREHARAPTEKCPENIFKKIRNVGQIERAIKSDRVAFNSCRKSSMLEGWADGRFSASTE